MGKIKLANGTELNVTNVELVKGVLKISTNDLTVEKLATLFSNKDNTCFINLLTDNREESGYKKGFTSFAGISYGTDGVKTVELYQPVDATELRISNAEATASEASSIASVANSVADVANATANNASEQAVLLAEQADVLIATVDSILTDIIPSLMG